MFLISESSKIHSQLVKIITIRFRVIPLQFKINFQGMGKMTGLIIPPEIFFLQKDTSGDFLDTPGPKKAHL